MNKHIKQTLIYKALKKAARKGITWIAFASFILLLFKVLYLNQIKQPFIGMFELGIVAESVLASIVSSYLFYFIVIHLEEVRAKEIVKPSIINLLDDIIRVCRLEINQLSNETKIPIDFESIDEKSIKKIFGLISPNAEAPLILGPFMRKATWMEFFQLNLSKIHSNAGMLISRISYLEPELISLLDEIDNCSFSKQMNILKGSPIESPSMNPWVRAYYEYVLLCRNLWKYRVKNVI